MSAIVSWGRLRNCVEGASSTSEDDEEEAEDGVPTREELEEMERVVMGSVLKKERPLGGNFLISVQLINVFRFPGIVPG